MSDGLGRLVRNARARRDPQRRATAGRVERVEGSGYPVTDPVEIARRVDWDAASDDAALHREVDRVVREDPSLSALAGAGDAGEGRRDPQPQRERDDLGSRVRAVAHRSRLDDHGDG